MHACVKNNHVELNSSVKNHPPYLLADVACMHLNIICMQSLADCIGS